MPKPSDILDRVLVLEMVRVTEAAAMAAAKLIGRGDEKAADAAAVEAMRRAFDTLQMDGTYEVSRGRCFHSDAPRCSLYGQSLVNHNEGRLNDTTGRCYHLDAPHYSLYE